MVKKAPSIVLVLLASVMCLTATGCDSCDTEAVSDFFEDMASSLEYERGDTRITISIDYKANLLLAKDNLDVYLDSEHVYTIENGSDETYTFDTVPGEHTLMLSRGLFTSASQSFKVEKSGDAFLFSVKNSNSGIELALTNSYNTEDALKYWSYGWGEDGFSVPSDADSSDVSDSQGDDSYNGLYGYDYGYPDWTFESSEEYWYYSEEYSYE